VALLTRGPGFVGIVERNLVVEHHVDRQNHLNHAARQAQCYDRVEVRKDSLQGGRRDVDVVHVGHHVLEGVNESTVLEGVLGGLEEAGSEGEVVVESRSRGGEQACIGFGIQ